MKNVVVAGATGLVGSAVVRLLEGRAEVRVHGLVRRATGRASDVPFDYRADLAKLGREIECDVLISCLGTTIRKAGSQAAFRAVDHELPALLVKRLCELPARPGFALVSSVGARAQGAFYLRTKFETEEVVRRSGLAYLIVRPSVLDGERGEARFVEQASLALLRPLCRVITGLTGRSSRLAGLYQPIPAAQVARTLVRLAVDNLPPNKTVEGWDLYDP